MLDLIAITKLLEPPSPLTGDAPVHTLPNININLCLTVVNVLACFFC